MPDPRQVAAYEEALVTIAAATVRTRATVRGFDVGPHAARDLLTQCESALSGLIALGAVPTPRTALQGPQIAAEDPQVYLSWSDDGITLVCEREECMVPGTSSAGLCWYQVLLPFKLTPEQARDARDGHLRTHR